MAQLVIAEGLGGLGITELLPQAAEQHVGLLGDEHQLPHRWPIHLAGAGRPEATHQPQQGGFAATGGPHDQQPLPLLQAKAEIADQGAVAAGGGQLHMGKTNRPRRRRLCRLARRCGGTRGGLQGQGLHLALETLQTLDRSRKGGQAINVVDQITHRSEHLGKGDSGLAKDTEIDLAGEIEGGDHQPGQKIREIVIGRLDNTNQGLPGDQALGVADGAAEAVPGLLPFTGFAPVKGNRLGVVAQSHEAIAEIGFQAQLLTVEGHQPTAGQQHQSGAKDGINEQQDGQAAIDRPKHNNEAKEAQHRLENSHRDAEAGAGETGRILGNALVGIINFCPICGHGCTAAPQPALGANSETRSRTRSEPRIQTGIQAVIGPLAQIESQ